MTTSATIDGAMKTGTLILVAVIGLVVIPFVLSFLLELTNKKGVATALKSAEAVRAASYSTYSRRPLR